MVRRRRDTYDMVVAGGGIAGLTAAWAGVGRGLAVALIEGSGLFGGQVANVEAVEGFPAVGELSGIALASTLVDRIRAGGGTILEEEVRGLELGDAAPAGLKRVVTDRGGHRAQQVIVATGAGLRRLGVPGEAALAGRGVSQCASCDGPFFRGEDVVVVGGGDAALQEALVLAALCRSVTIACRSRLRARQGLVGRVTALPNVRFLWDVEVDRIAGEDAVAGVRLRNRKSGAVEEIACAGVFPFIGSDPAVDWLPPELARGLDGGLATDAAHATSVPGVYAVGAARSGYSGQLASAAGEAAAAVEAAWAAREG